jgi:hypothetical protein
MAGLNEIRDFYRRCTDFQVDVYDLRPERTRKISGVIVGHESLAGDPAGYVRVNLDRQSMFCEIPHVCHLLYGAEYDTAEVRQHHHGDVHEYLISRTILNADCVINLAKLKTHKKTGITACLKNLVGINGNKNWLPHYREGTPSQGGDQFAEDRRLRRLERRIAAGFKRVFPLLGPLRGSLARPALALGKRLFGDTNLGAIRSGNWHANDTTWRMVLDLNRILLYVDREGHLQGRPARRTVSIVDGIVGGEGNGPLDPTPKRAGVVLAGSSPLAVDLVGARLMGLDYRHLPLLTRGLDSHSLPLASWAYEDLVCACEDAAFLTPLTEGKLPVLHFRPPLGWQGHVELEERT